MQPGLAVDVRVDYIDVLILFGRIAGDISFLGPVCKPKHVFKELILILSLLVLGLLKILAD